jgi:hypothetical protein
LSAPQKWIASCGLRGRGRDERCDILRAVTVSPSQIDPGFPQF